MKRDRSPPTTDSGLPISHPTTDSGRPISPSLRASRSGYAPVSPSLRRPVAPPPPPPEAPPEAPISPSLRRPAALPIKKMPVVNVQTAPSLREALFPEEERTKVAYTKMHGKRNEYRVSEVDSDGGIYGGCSNCRKNYFLDMTQFAPPDNLKNCQRRPDFFNALRAFSVAYENSDLVEARKCRKKVDELRNVMCPSCQKPPGYLSLAEQPCKDEYIRMRKEACAKNNGCANQNCVERGDQAWCVLQGDHLHTINDQDEAKRKTWALGDYKKWSRLGGVPAMRAEEAKGMQWICGFCHSLEATSSAANRCSNPSTMPDGKWNGTPEEVKAYDAKRHAECKYDKQQYVDARKREIGRCKHCHRSVVEGQEVCFHFDHRDESTKMRKTKGLCTKNGGVSGMVHCVAKSARLDAPGFKDLFDAEMDDKCDLLCQNCHHRKTWHYPHRE